MTQVALSHPVLSLSLPAWFWPLLRRCAGHSQALPQDLPDWQLRDLAITRPFPGPGSSTCIWLP